jgi:hypothetical protein
LRQTESPAIDGLAVELKLGRQHVSVAVHPWPARKALP